MAGSLPSSETHAPSDRAGDRPLALESDLSCDLPVSDKELDAITRLLGEALYKLLAGSQSA
jgi:hypothetical protein